MASRQKIKGQLKKSSCKGSSSSKRGSYKNKKGEIWDKKALNALFNKTVQYSVVNNYIVIITKFYMWQQLKNKILLPL